ncbi:Beta-phosphoglucomutase [Richelia intracellularis]|nr:Beta-phosphoglucomutase [Richelia intracellularis]
MLEVLNIKDIFDIIVLADDCIAGKPSPIPYEKALKQLNENGEVALQSIALEDSPSGIHSAVSTGIPTIGITSTHNPESLRENGAFMTIRYFTDLQLWTHLNGKSEGR